jgi:hypothetical protein
MAEIRECDVCGKRTDFWTDIAARTEQGQRMQKDWRMTLCLTCAETETIASAMTAASEHVTQRCHDEGKA